MTSKLCKRNTTFNPSSFISGQKKTDFKFQKMEESYADASRVGKEIRTKLANGTNIVVPKDCVLRAYRDTIEEKKCSYFNVGGYNEKLKRQLVSMGYEDVNDKYDYELLALIYYLKKKVYTDNTKQYFSKKLSSIALLVEGTASATGYMEKAGLSNFLTTTIGPFIDAAVDFAVSTEEMTSDKDVNVNEISGPNTDLIKSSLKIAIAPFIAKNTEDPGESLTISTSMIEVLTLNSDTIKSEDINNIVKFFMKFRGKNITTPSKADDEF